MKGRAKRYPALFGALAALVLIAMAAHAQTKDQLAAARNHYSLAQDYLKQSQRDKAVAELKAAIQLAPEFIEAHNDYIANQQGKPAEIVAEYEGYLKQHPQSAVFHYLMGKAYAKGGRAKDAETEYQKSLDLSPGFSWALLELGTLALNAQDKVKAGEFFEKARAKAGDSTKLHMTLATRLNSAQKYESALAEVQRVLKLDPDSFDAYPTLWRTKMRITSGSEKTQAEVRQEIKNLETRFSKNPKALDAAMKGYGIFFEEEEAARIRKSILAIDPNYFAASGGARFMVMTPAGKELSFSGPMVDRIMEASALKDVKAQIAAFQQIEKEIQDEDLKIHLLYSREASAHLRDGDLENAERLMALMEKGGARITSIQQQLATAYVDRKIKLDTAKVYIDQGVEAARKSLTQMETAKGSEAALASQKSGLAQWLYVQGRLLMAQGATEQAIVPLAESIRLAEREAAALELGQAYVKLNRIEDAIGMLALACAFEGPKKEVARTALERIYSGRESSKPLAALISEAVEKRKLASRATAARSEPAAALEGKAAPPFELTSVSGQKVNLSNYQGKVILLNFWATW